MRNSSSCDACADASIRTDEASLRPASFSRSRTLSSASFQVTTCCTPSRVAHQRPAEALLAFDPQVLEAADVAHPEVVDRGVVARRDAHQPRALRPFRLGLQPGGGAATLRAQRARGVHGVRVVPRARPEPVLPGRDGADRADVHQVARQQRVDALLLERRDFGAVAAVDDADLRVAVDLAHEALAARAHDAAVAVQHQRRAEVDVGLDAIAVERAPREVHAALGVAELVREVLQRALAALVAHRAVERVIDEQELEHAGPAFDRLGIVGAHDHALGHRRRARRLQLRHLLDLHEADAARRVDAETGVVTVVGNLDSGLDGGLEHGGALGDGDLATIDGQRDFFHPEMILHRRVLGCGPSPNGSWLSASWWRRLGGSAAGPATGAPGLDLCHPRRVGPAGAARRRARRRPERPAADAAGRWRVRLGMSERPSGPARSRADRRAGPRARRDRRADGPAVPIGPQPLLGGARPDRSRHEREVTAIYVR